MAKAEVVPEKNVWTLSEFRNRGFTKFPIEVMSGQVAINTASVLGTDSVICAKHRVVLVPDFGTLIAGVSKMQRKCPISECQTRAEIGPYIFPLNFQIRQSWNQIKRADAKRYLDIHGPSNKPHEPKH